MDPAEHGVELMRGEGCAEKDEAESDDGGAEGDGQDEGEYAGLQSRLSVCDPVVHVHGSSRHTTSLNPIPGSPNEPPAFFFCPCFVFGCSEAWLLPGMHRQRYTTCRMATAIAVFGSVSIAFSTRESNW